MLIDWFTVGAQVVNFLILVWLLKRFLYHPILDAIDAREKRIAKELADADAKKAEALKERDEFQHKNEAFEQQRATLMVQAKDEAKTERLRLLDEARQAADSLSAKRQETLRNDAHHLNGAPTEFGKNSTLSVATCNQKCSDLHSAAFPTRINCN
jgi:F-type H+-transporting ATPase subunit b